MTTANQLATLALDASGRRDYYTLATETTPDGDIATLEHRHPAEHDSDMLEMTVAASKHSVVLTFTYPERGLPGGFGVSSDVYDLDDWTDGVLAAATAIHTWLTTY